MPLDILTLGEALVEIMRTEKDQPLDKVGTFSGPYPSGAPFIFAVQAARLGAMVAPLGVVGDDAFGKCLIEQLQSDKVDIRGVTTSHTHTTGVAFVAYFTGPRESRRDFVYHLRHAAAGQITPAILDEKLFEGLKALHLMGSTLISHPFARETGMKALHMAQEAGAKFSFDPNLRKQLMPNDMARDTLAPFIEAADVLLPTAEETKILTGKETVEEGVKVWLDVKPERIIVVTAGKSGSTVYTTAGSTHVPAFTAEEVDETGAGDCFDAGFLVRWLMGDSPEEAARFGNACGALSVMHMGPMSGARTIEEVRAFIAKQSGEAPTVTAPSLEPEVDKDDTAEVPAVTPAPTAETAATVKDDDKVSALPQTETPPPTPPVSAPELPEPPSSLFGSILDTFRPGTPPQAAPESKADAAPASEEKPLSSASEAKPDEEKPKPFWDRERTQQLKRPTQEE